MSATPEQDAYLALLRLPDNGPRSTAAIQAAMATLRDYIAADAGKDPELVQDISEQIARMSSTRADIERPWFDKLIEREALIRAQSEREKVLVELLQRLEPSIGWRSATGTSRDFRCEFCHQTHEHFAHIEHTDKCPVPQVRAALAGAR